jgi:hypothetical protein
MSIQHNKYAAEFIYFASRFNKFSRKKTLCLSPSEIITLAPDFFLTTKDSACVAVRTLVRSCRFLINNQCGSKLQVYTMTPKMEANMAAKMEAKMAACESPMTLAPSLLSFTRVCVLAIISAASSGDMLAFNSAAFSFPRVSLHC